jgi:uncharacterized repeat protein (TIGR01451 family)
MRSRFCRQLGFGLLLGLAAVSELRAQTVDGTNYPFSTATGVVLEVMSSGTTQLVAANLDDTASPVASIGFDFWFLAVRYTQFSVNANGLARLGPTAVSTAFNNNSGFAAAANNPKIAPYFDDLFVGTNGKVHYKVVGSAPSRKLVVEWLNMQIPRVGPGLAGAGTFQMWLFETTGVIELVYGSGIALNSANGGYSVGLANGGASFGSVTTSVPAVSYIAANNSQTNAIAGGTAYIFAPPTPTAPTNLTFTGVAAVGMTLNWIDSPDELAYSIEMSTDGTNYATVGTAAGGATFFPVTGLVPSTTYFWRVYAVSSGALSVPPLSGSQPTNAPGNVASNGAGGNWSAPATWAGGVVPTSSDNVTIVDGSTVTIDTAAVAYALAVGQGASGILQFEPATARSLTVGANVTIASGGTFQSAATGTVTTHGLVLGGSLINDGTLEFSTNLGTAGATITFTGAQNAAFSGSGGTTDVRLIVVNKGTTSASVLELMPSSFTVRGVTTNVAGFLTLTNGTFKLSGAFAGTNRVFTAAAYTIPASCGFWLDNPNYTVSGQAGGLATSNNGLLRVSQGVFNIGVGPADGMGGGAGAVFVIEGGTVDASGRLDPQAAVSYTQTGGTVNVAVVGNTRSNTGSFELFSTLSSFTMSGGTINIINRNTGAIQADYAVRSSTFNVTGGVVVFGGTGALPGTTYINNSGGLVPAFIVNPTMTFNLNNAILSLRGATVTNNGAITSTGANPRFDFAGGAPMSYSGSGTFGTAVTPFGGSGVSSNSPSLVTLNAPIVTNRVNLVQGGFVNSNQITLGNGGASTTTVQIGTAGLTSAGGSFDVSPNHLQGTGGQIVVYAFETAPRTTGFEINPTRILTRLSVDNPNNVTVSGGDLTVTSTAISPNNALTLTSGRVITGSNALLMPNAASIVVRTSGYVDGNLRKNFSAAGGKTFEVGTANGYSPVSFNATAGTFPGDVAVTAVASTAPGIFPVNKAITRYWRLAASGLTADLTFTYLDPGDLPGTVTEANLHVYRHDAAFTDLGGTIDTAANTAAVTGVTTFSDWTLAEPGATAAADLSITKTDGVTTAYPGQTISYAIVAGNGGPAAVTGATVTDTMPAALTGATWTCVGAGGGTCTASGTGNIADIVDLPVGATVTYTVTGIVDQSATGVLSNAAFIAAPAGVTDPVPGNDSATDTDWLIACNSEIVAVPDGRVTASTLPAGANGWFGASLRIGSSYSVEFQNDTGSGIPPGILTVFSGDDACGGSSTLTTTDTSAIDPAGTNGIARMSFTAPGTQTYFRARLVNSTGGPVAFSFGWSETTLFSAAWSTNGGFDAFYSFLNTTAVAIGGTLTLLDTTGVVLSSFNLTIPAGQTTSTNTAALAVARNRTGSARFTHNGPPGAIVVEAAIANFSLSPAYVQPVKFRATRESAH